MWNTCWITADGLQLITASVKDPLPIILIFLSSIVTPLHTMYMLMSLCTPIACLIAICASLIPCSAVSSTTYVLVSNLIQSCFLCCSRLELQPSRTSPLAGSLELHTPIDWCCFVHSWVVRCAVRCLCCGFSNHRVTFLFGRRHLFSLRPVRPLVCILRSLVVSASSTRSIHSLNPISRD